MSLKSLIQPTGTRGSTWGHKMKMVGVLLCFLWGGHFLWSFQMAAAAPRQQTMPDSINIANLINVDCLLNRADLSADGLDPDGSTHSASNCLSLIDLNGPMDLESYCIEQHGNAETDPGAAVTIVNWTQVDSDVTDTTDSATDNATGSLSCLIDYPSDGGSVAGDLWLDSDGNGLQDAGEAPMGGVLIELYDADGTQIAVVTTNAAGQYAFVSATDPRLATIYNPLPAHVGVVPSSGPLGGLPPETHFQLQADMNQGAIGGRGLTKINVDNGLPNADEVDSDAFRVTTSSGESRAVINVVTGELGRDDTTNDFGFGPFTALIGGEAWNDLENSGIQNPMIPLAKGVTINLINGHDQLVATTVTANGGTYTFDKLPAETYLVEFRPASATTWFSLKDQGADDALDSDVNAANGRTDLLTVANGETHPVTDAGLVRGIPGNYPPQLANPGTQFNALGDQVQTIFVALDAVGDSLSYQAMGLPLGLSMDSNSGHITGVPTAVGTYAVIVTTYDGKGGVTDIAFNWTISQTPAIVCSDSEQEAEDARLLGGFAKVIEVDGASGNQHVLVTNGSGNQWNGFNAQDQARFCFNVPTSGRYTLIGTTAATSNADDSFYITVNHAPSQGFLWDLGQSSNQSSDYASSAVTHRLPDDQLLEPVEVWLAAGNQQISVGLREDGTRLDKLALQLEEAASTPSCSGLSVEAEHGALSGSFSIVDDPGASNGQYIHVPEGIGTNLNGISLNGSPVADRVDYCFQVIQAGQYTLVGSLLADSANNGSVYVRINGLPTAGYLWDLAISTGFVDDVMNDRDKDDPASFYLGVGLHTVTIYLREDGAKFDKFTLVPADGALLAGAGSDNGVSAADLNPELNPAELNQPTDPTETAGLADASGGNERMVRGYLAVPTSHRWEPELAGVTVNVTADSGYSSMVTTDAYGGYYVDELGDGDYTISVNLPEGDEGTSQRSQRFAITNGAAADASFTYEPPGAGFGIFFPFVAR